HHPSRRRPPARYAHRDVEPAAPLAPPAGEHSGAPWIAASPAPHARRAEHRPRGPGDSQSRPAGRRPDTARYAPQSAASPRHRSPDRPGVPHAALPDRAGWRARSSPPGSRTALSVGGVRRPDCHAHLWATPVWLSGPPALLTVSWRHPPLPRPWARRRPRPVRPPPHPWPSAWPESVRPSRLPDTRHRA